jgi:hypothetical protein
MILTIEQTVIIDPRRPDSTIQVPFCVHVESPAVSLVFYIRTDLHYFSYY